MRTLIEHPTLRGRGAQSNRASRFEPTQRQRVDDGWDGLEGDVARATRTHPLTIKSALSFNASPDLPFDRTLNPYKGCEHGCVYCYARPGHAYLGYSPGLDFETELFTKPNAAEVLRRELARPGYRPAPIVIGGDTDPYQPIEREHRTTRALLDVLWEARHPASIVTKSDRVLDDLERLAAMARHGLMNVAVSVTTLDVPLARDMEPRASAPKRRLAAMSALHKAGIPVRVMAAPMIPGLNDHELEPILDQAAQAGACGAGYVLLRLPREIAGLFEEWLTARRPNAKARVLRHVREARGGALYEADWGVRGRGRGPYADLLRRRFAAACARHGLTERRATLRIDQFRRPSTGRQRDLFADTP